MNDSNAISANFRSFCLSKQTVFEEIFLKVSFDYLRLFFLVCSEGHGNLDHYKCLTWWAQMFNMFDLIFKVAS